jgi:hypothetical protein
MSSVPSTAGQQGIAEADSAVSQGLTLGFSTGTVYYYDLEGFNTADSSCHTAVRYFLDGWVSRLQNYWGLKGGVYGSRSSAPSDWAIISHPPREAWIALWNGVNSVWNVCGLANTKWVSDQRHHQYDPAGNSRIETWNGGSMDVDNNCSDGLVAGSNFPEADAPGTNEANSPSEDPSC